MLYKRTELTKGLFFKIISKRNFNNWSELSSISSKFWELKYNQYYKNLSGHTTFIDDAYQLFADYIPEFSSITEIAIGVIEEIDKELEIVIVPIEGSTEKELLTNFSDAIMKLNDLTIGGYNITNYQLPFIIKRMLINKVKLPNLFNIKGKKPWEINIIDIMKDYQGNMFGDIDLELLANNFNIKYEQNQLNTATGELKIALEIAKEMSF